MTTEVFRFLGKDFDIDKAREIINKNPRRVVRMRVADAACMLVLVAVDHDTAMSSEREDPIFVGSLEQGAIPIDGWHRIYKKHVNRDTFIDAYLLDRTETESIVTEREINVNVREDSDFRIIKSRC